MINKSLLFVFIFTLVRFGSTQNVLESPHGNRMQITCETCHTTADWNNIPGWKFNHDQTGFALFGSHKNAECRDCHQSLIFNQVGVSCIDCHTDVHKSELGIECENCHNSQSWENRSMIMDQHSQTNFPLVGVHANLDCESCHVNEQERQFATISVECQSCHLGDYMATLNPAHQKANFDLDCRKCHLQVKTNWNTSSFEHPLTFQLNGAHKMVDCVDCHGSVYKGISVECYSCHKTDFEIAVNPDHATFGFPTVCEECHSDVSWERSVFDHLAESGFVVEGAHTEILCTDCHQNNQLTGLALDCIGCHREDYNLAIDPHHVQNNFSEDCLECHSVNAWEPATFDHTKTQFPLDGAHISIDCADCHTSGYIEQLPTDCFSCHELDFTTVSDPNHISNNFDHDCMACHTTNAWEPATFDHTKTQFPLDGAHINIDCADCHTSGYIEQLPTDCFSCHELDFTTVSDPSHISNNFDHDCLLCHTTNAWEPASFDHTNTQFPLDGAHINIDCADCHTSGYIEQLPTDCFSCHELDFTTVSDPNHVSNNFDHDCLLCHTTNVWQPASFDHASTQLPLTGAHINVDCSNCHTSGYQNTPFECVACHQTDYDQTTDPHHVNAQFPTTCETCHNAVAWDQTSWDHDGQYFPIYTGAHNEEWDVCLDCHNNPADYSQFTCTNCHERTRMDEKHKEEPEYEYDSIRCYECHPDGKS